MSYIEILAIIAISAFAIIAFAVVPFSEPDPFVARMKNIQKMYVEALFLKAAKELNENEVRLDAIEKALRSNEDGDRAGLVAEAHEIRTRIAGIKRRKEYWKKQMEDMNEQDR